MVSSCSARSSLFLLQVYVQSVFFFQCRTGNPFYIAPKASLGELAAAAAPEVVAAIARLLLSELTPPATIS